MANLTRTNDSSRDPFLCMSTEEMVAQGYVVITQCGLTTRYLPTDKYRATMGLPPLGAITVHTERVIIDFDPEEVYYLCGECGENYPNCACKVIPQAPPTLRLLTSGG